MTLKTFQYNTPEERQLIIETQVAAGLFLHEEQLLLTGNFLIFRDEVIPIQPLYIEGDLRGLESQVSELKSQNAQMLLALVIGGLM